MNRGRLFSPFLFCMAALAVSGSARALTINLVQNNAPAMPFVVQSVTPYDEEEVKEAKSYRMQFTLPIRPDRSDIRIVGSFGNVIPTTQLASPDGISLSTTFDALPPGRYTVKWRTECRCNGNLQLQDTYHFTVSY